MRATSTGEDRKGPIYMARLTVLTFWNAVRKPITPESPFSEAVAPHPPLLLIAVVKQGYRAREAVSGWPGCASR